MPFVNTFLPLPLLVLLAIPLSACGILPFYAHENKILPREQSFHLGDPVPTNISEPIQAPNDFYVGIALSGGGSRAANFSAAVLLELQEFGILPKHVQAISSVSGSSLTAAYYGLFQQEKNKWNKAEVKRLLLTDFERSWLWRLVWPNNFIRYAFTNFDRSDVMKSVFDDVLFDEHLFSAMSSSKIEILINATKLDAYGKRFVFRGDDFRRIHSDINSFPISHAVMASGAFPGAFHNVTLKDFSNKGHYLHLYDGGPSDNLGIETLVEDVRNLYQDVQLNKEEIRLRLEKQIHEGGERAPVKGCFLIIVDAHTEPDGQLPLYHKEKDTRKLIDYLIDRNALHASDELLRYRVKHTLKKYGINNSWVKPYGSFVIEGGPGFFDGADSLECGVAVFHFERIRFLDPVYLDTMLPNAILTDRIAEESLNVYYNHVDQILYNILGYPCSYANINVHRIVNSVPTRYFLTSNYPELKENPAAIQRAIFDAAEILIWRDTEQRNFICNWFSQNGISSMDGCKEKKKKDKKYFQRKWELRQNKCGETAPHFNYD